MLHYNKKQKCCFFFGLIRVTLTQNVSHLNFAANYPTRPHRRLLILPQVFLMCRGDACVHRRVCVTHTDIPTYIHTGNLYFFILQYAPTKVEINNIFFIYFIEKVEMFHRMTRGELRSRESRIRLNRTIHHPFRATFRYTKSLRNTRAQLTNYLSLRYQKFK